LIVAELCISRFAVMLTKNPWILQRRMLKMPLAMSTQSRNRQTSAQQFQPYCLLLDLVLLLDWRPSTKKYGTARWMMPGFVMTGIQIYVDWSPTKIAWTFKLGRWMAYDEPFCVNREGLRDIFRTCYSMTTSRFQDNDFADCGGHCLGWWRWSKGLSNLKPVNRFIRIFKNCQVGHQLVTGVQINTLTTMATQHWPFMEACGWISWLRPNTGRTVLSASCDVYICFTIAYAPVEHELIWKVGLCCVRNYP
jgi:hypothetical protein